MSNKKERIDILMVEKGLVDSREKAKKYIMAGVVFIDNLRIDKPGIKVDEESNIVVKEDPIPYVSRGGLKLEKALNTFSVSVKNKVCIDVGASTGGFTDCMLQNGALKVYAVDVGYGQLAWKLRTDNRVIPIERTNVRYMNQETIGELVDFITVDVSFISLKLILPVLKNLLKDDGNIIALIKPQFEAGRDKVGKKGVVKDPRVHIEVLNSIFNFCILNELSIVDLSYSPIKGTEGNIEYLAHIVKKKESNKLNFEKLIENVVNEANINL